MKKTKSNHTKNRIYNNNIIKFPNEKITKEELAYRQQRQKIIIDLILKALEVEDKDIHRNLEKT